MSTIFRAAHQAAKTLLPSLSCPHSTLYSNSSRNMQMFIYHWWQKTILLLWEANRLSAHSHVWYWLRIRIHLNPNGVFLCSKYVKKMTKKRSAFDSSYLWKYFDIHADHMWYGWVRQRRLLYIAGVCVHRNEETTTSVRYFFLLKKQQELICRRVIANNGNATLSSHNFCCLDLLFYSSSIPFNVRSIAVCWLYCVHRLRWCVCEQWACLLSVCLRRERKNKANHVLCLLCIQMVTQYTDSETRSILWLSLILMRSIRFRRYLFERSLSRSSVHSICVCILLSAHTVIGVFDTWPPSLENSTTHIFAIVPVSHYWKYVGCGL